MRRNAAFTMIELMIVIAIIAIIAAIAIPSLLQARKSANEASAIGALKTIHSAQAMFRDGDKDGDGEDYATLPQLATAGYLLDPALADGTKQGYRFETGSGNGPGVDPGAALFIIANPVAPGSSGDRSFCANSGGVIYFTTSTIAGAPLTTAGEIPPNVIPLR